MKALLLFHLRVGARVAIRSFIPFFAAILVAVMLQIDPVATATSMALRVCAVRPTMSEILLAIGAGLLFPAWAVPQLAMGLNGWMRHLPLSQANNRRGLVLALLTVQMPLAFSFLLLAMVARSHGLSVTGPMLRLGLTLAAGAFAAMPVRRQWLTAPLSLVAAFLAFSPDRWPAIPAAALLLCTDLLAGPVRRLRRRRRTRAAGSLLTFRISWRAIGWRAAGCYLFGAIPLAAAGLFLSNNGLEGAIARGAARFGIALAAVAVVSAMARRLALRRPPWPLSRSFPWSAAHRVAADALFLGLHAMLLIAAGCRLEPVAAVQTLALVPLLSLRAAECMRRMPGRRTGAGSFVAEGVFIAGSSALLPWAAFFWLVAAVPAFYSARNAEAGQKVTRWLDLHYAAAGDPLSWSD